MALTAAPATLLALWLISSGLKYYQTTYAALRRDDRRD
jgi:hypothetical protein